MLQRFQASLVRFMTGRYGNDQLNFTLMVSALILNLLSPPFGRHGQSIPNLVAMLLMGVRSRIEPFWDLCDPSVKLLRFCG